MTKQGKYSRTIKGQYAKLKSSSKERGIPLKLNFVEFELLRRYPCAYCGDSLADVGHGLDRLDSNGPYSKENVVACCWSCNRAKGDNVDRLEVMLFGAVKRVLRAYRKLNKGRRRNNNSV